MIYFSVNFFQIFYYTLVKLMTGDEFQRLIRCKFLYNNIGRDSIDFKSFKVQVPKLVNVYVFNYLNSFKVQVKLVICIETKYLESDSNSGTRNLTCSLAHQNKNRSPVGDSIFSQKRSKKRKQNQLILNNNTLCKYRGL